MNIIKKTTKIVTLISVLFSFQALAQQTIKISASAEDITPVIRAALDKVTDKDLKIIFEKGTYKFLPEFAVNQYSYITNHGNGLKNIIFPLKNFNSIEIEGNGAEFIFHGLIAPFQLYNNKKISIKNLTLDWDIPFTFLGEVMAIDEKEGWRDIKPATESHSWKLSHGQLLFPNVDGFNYHSLGSTLAFNAKYKRVAHGAWDMHSNPSLVEKRPGGILRFHEKLKRYPEVGQLLSSKGNRELDRYAPAFQVKNSSNVVFNNVVVHHALGMGFLFERTNNIKVLNSGVYLRKNSPRVISSTADATHFANCRGDVLIENSRFENMLDDGTNVHGTYTEVVEKLASNKVRVQLKHFEQTGFEFAGINDEIWFIHQPSVQRASTNKVTAVDKYNDRYIDLTFKHPLPAQTKTGDLLENKTWNPRFTMRGNTIRNHRARNIVLKTPLKTIIENNNLSSMMSSILFRGESYFWYESGVVEDVIIRNNNFDYVAYSGSQHAVIYVTPRLGKNFNQKELYDRNIRFENNTIKTFDNRIVWADRVDGMVIKNNTIIKNNEHPQLYPKAPLFEFVNSKNVELINNHYEGNYPIAVKADKTSASTLKNDGSIK